jgi:hypothetical protein
MEKEILEATKEFCINNDVEWNEIIEAIILNTIRETRVQCANKLDKCKTWLFSENGRPLDLIDLSEAKDKIKEG